MCSEARRTRTTMCRRRGGADPVWYRAEWYDVGVEMSDKSSTYA